MLLTGIFIVHVGLNSSGRGNANSSDVHHMSPAENHRKVLVESSVNPGTSGSIKPSFVMPSTCFRPSMSIAREEEGFSPDTAEAVFQSPNSTYVHGKEHWLHVGVTSQAYGSRLLSCPHIVLKSSFVDTPVPCVSHELESPKKEILPAVTEGGYEADFAIHSSTIHDAVLFASPADVPHTGCVHSPTQLPANATAIPPCKDCTSCDLPFSVPTACAIAKEHNIELERYDLDRAPQTIRLSLASDDTSSSCETHCGIHCSFIYALNLSFLRRAQLLAILMYYFFKPIKLLHQMLCFFFCNFVCLKYKNIHRVQFGSSAKLLSSLYACKSLRMQSFSSDSKRFILSSPKAQGRDEADIAIFCSSMDKIALLSSATGVPHINHQLLVNTADFITPEVYTCCVLACLLQTAYAIDKDCIIDFERCVHHSAQQAFWFSLLSFDGAGGYKVQRHISYCCTNVAKLLSILKVCVWLLRTPTQNFSKPIRTFHQMSCIIFRSCICLEYQNMSCLHFGSFTRYLTIFDSCKPFELQSFISDSTCIILSSSKSSVVDTSCHFEKLAFLVATKCDKRYNLSSTTDADIVDSQHFFWKALIMLFLRVLHYNTTILKQLKARQFSKEEVALDISLGYHLYKKIQWHSHLPMYLVSVRTLSCRDGRLTLEYWHKQCHFLCNIVSVTKFVHVIKGLSYFSACTCDFGRQMLVSLAVSCDTFYFSEFQLGSLCNRCISQWCSYQTLVYPGGEVYIRLFLSTLCYKLTFLLEYIIEFQLAVLNLYNILLVSFHLLQQIVFPEAFLYLQSDCSLSNLLMDEMSSCTVSCSTCAQPTCRTNGELHCFEKVLELNHLLMCLLHMGVPFIPPKKVFFSAATTENHGTNWYKIFMTQMVVLVWSVIYLYVCALGHFLKMALLKACHNFQNLC